MTMASAGGRLVVNFEVSSNYERSHIDEENGKAQKRAHIPLFSSPSRFI